MMRLLIFLLFWRMRLHEGCNPQDAFEFTLILGICFLLKNQMPKIITVSNGQILTRPTNNSPSQYQPWPNAVFTLSRKTGFFSPAAFAAAFITWKKVKLMVLIADS